MQIATMKILLVCGLFFMLLSPLTAFGEQAYPMGLNEKEWNALSSQKQAEYRAEQYRIDEARRKRAEELEIAEAKARANEITAKKKEIKKRYENARYGDIIQVNISDGKMEIGGKRRPYEPMPFTLVKGVFKRITFRSTKKKKKWLSFTYDIKVGVAYFNNAFYFDLGKDPKHPNRKFIKILENSSWEKGMHYQPNPLDDSSEAIGIDVFIKYVRTPDVKRIEVIHKKEE